MNIFTLHSASLVLSCIKTCGMKVKREEVKMVLIMFIFAVCRRKGSAL